MAIVKGNIIGNMSGKIGNLSARTVGGKTILSARPSSYNVSYQPALVEIRQKFAVTSNLSKNILSLTKLAAIWKTVKLPGLSAFNTIFKSNFFYSSAERPTENNIITPGGFGLPVNTVAVDTDKITASLLALGTAAVFSPLEVALTANAIVCFYDPTNPEDVPYKVIACSKEVPNFNFDQAYDLQLDFDIVQKIVAARYTKSILYLSVASLTADGKVIQYSSTTPKAN